MAKEIERKFLVRSEGWRALAASSSRIRQGYLATMADRSVRVRMRDDAATMTIKVGTAIKIRDEFEYTIPASDAEEMLTLAIGRVIEKTRNLVPFAGHTWEVDVFEGQFAGLIVAEIELKDETEEPELPDWVGTEVTSDRRFANQSLALAEAAPEVKDGLSA